MEEDKNGRKCYGYSKVINVEENIKPENCKTVFEEVLINRVSTYAPLVGR